MKTLLLSIATAALAFAGFNTNSAQAQGTHSHHACDSRVVIYGGFGGYGGGYPVYVPSYQQYPLSGMYAPRYMGGYDQGYHRLFSQGNYGLFNNAPSPYYANQTYENMNYRGFYYGRSY